MRYDQMSDDGVVAELGRRVAMYRAARGLTQGELADVTGLGRSTVQRIERGDSIQLASLVKILRAFDRLDALDAVLVPRLRSPLAELRRERGGRRRVRHASGGETAAGGADASPWVWGDEEEGEDAR